MADKYTLTFVCEGCILAHFHECCGNFCNCELDLANDVDLVNGECTGYDAERKKHNGKD